MRLPEVVSGKLPTSRAASYRIMGNFSDLPVYEARCVEGVQLATYSSLFSRRGGAGGVHRVREWTQLVGVLCTDLL